MNTSDFTELTYVDPEEISIELAKILIKLARKSIEYYINNDHVLEIPKDLEKKYPILSKKAAVFITLEKIDNRNKRSLRGCIGFILPHYKLGKAIVESAISSAFRDPRFPPLERDEINHIVIELSILGERRKIRDIDSIIIGKDGLYVEKGINSGILLPQVPIEYCWDKDTFIAETCIKAGLKPTCWLHDDVSIYRIPGRTFIETKPNGEIVERDLVEEYKRKCDRVNMD